MRRHSLQRLPHSSPTHFSPSLTLTHTSTPSVCQPITGIQRVYMIIDYIPTKNNGINIHTRISIYPYLYVKISVNQRQKQIFQKKTEIVNSDKISKATAEFSYENRKGGKLSRGEKTKWKSFDAVSAIVVGIVCSRSQLAI